MYYVEYRYVPPRVAGVNGRLCECQANLASGPFDAL